MTTSDAPMAEGRRTWFGYADARFVGPDGRTAILLPYVKEPPHGESLHKIILGNVELPGYAWGNGIAWSPCGRYVLLDYSPNREALERCTMVLDVQSTRWFVLPSYLAASRFQFPRVFLTSGGTERLGFQFTGNEVWQSVA